MIKAIFSAMFQPDFSQTYIEVLEAPISSTYTVKTTSVKSTVVETIMLKSNCISSSAV